MLGLPTRRLALIIEQRYVAYIDDAEVEPLSCIVSSSTAAEHQSTFVAIQMSVSHAPRTPIIKRQINEAANRLGATAFLKK